MSDDAGTAVATKKVEPGGLDAAITSARHAYEVLRRAMVGGGLPASGKAMQEALRKLYAEEVVTFLVATMRGEALFVDFAAHEGTLSMYQVPAPAGARVKAAETLFEKMGLPKVDLIGAADDTGIIALPELEMQAIQAQVEVALLTQGRSYSVTGEDGTIYRVEDAEPGEFEPPAREVEQDVTSAIHDDAGRRDGRGAKETRSARRERTVDPEIVARVRARRKRGNGNGHG